ncbi:MAG TPA: transporter substrate-binding domain-containing protein [Humidesulfovibrio sp.]|uniref:substrate-binding periplasmic protein n=1 Tax=Humidesulfovibrio sp. TaxID=2910988 RepID=UPI002C198FE7|nr:transporter substrate-binding domain-containing protein [Humidesulfovibrio sp.]HWR02988.1 transporter substrate-binding domain-containing protein [Humidesulfovibrio sp.]
MLKAGFFLSRLAPALLAALLFQTAAFAAGPAQAAPLVLNTDGAPPHARPDGTGFEDRIVAEAFRRIGVPVKLVMLPSERCLQNANLGIDDGNYVRVAGLEKTYPNLIMVPEPVSEFVFTAFTRAPELKISSWADLRQRQVAIVNGWKIVERQLAGAPRLKTARDEEALFALLDKGHAEVVVAGLHAGREIIRVRGYQGVRALSPPLAVEPMHLYLNARHAALVPKLSEALRAMRRDGTLPRLTRAGLAGNAP